MVGFVASDLHSTDNCERLEKIDAAQDGEQFERCCEHLSRPLSVLSPT